MAQRSSEASSRPWLIPAVLVLVVGLAFGGRYWLLGGDAEAEPIGGPFTLETHLGEAVTDRTYRSKFMLVYFGYANCPMVCPTSLQVIADALDQLSEAERARIAPLFITVDPARDSREAMAEYVAYFHPALIGLRGTPEQTAAVVAAYKVFSAPGETEDIDHSAFTYLMGPDGGFLRAFPYGMPSDAMARALRQAEVTTAPVS